LPLIGLTISQTGNILLRRDGESKMAGDLDTSGNKLVSVADPVEVGDAVNKKRVNLKVDKAGDELTGNLIMRLFGNNSISLGCNDLRAGKRLNLLLDNAQNTLFSQLSQPVISQTSTDLIVVLVTVILLNLMPQILYFTGISL
jgi:hypothetical protein